jgi:hypothetical protein
MRHHLRYLTASSWFNRTESRVASGGLPRHTTSASSYKHKPSPAGPRINTRECIRLEDQVLPEHPSPFPFRSPILCCYLRVIPSPAIIPTLRLSAHEHLFRRIQRSLISQANTSRHCQHSTFTYSTITFGSSAPISLFTSLCEYAIQHCYWFLSLLPVVIIRIVGRPRSVRSLPNAIAVVGLERLGEPAAPPRNAAVAATRPAG